MHLYRIVSDRERRDLQNSGQFRTAINTLEAKQFLKTEIAVHQFHARSIAQNFEPPYTSMVVVEIEEQLLALVPHITQELDTFDAISVFEDHLPALNDCINFVAIYDL